MEIPNIETSEKWTVESIHALIGNYTANQILAVGPVLDDLMRSREIVRIGDNRYIPTSRLIARNHGTGDLFAVAGQFAYRIQTVRRCVIAHHPLARGVPAPPITLDYMPYVTAGGFMLACENDEYGPRGMLFLRQDTDESGVVIRPWHTRFIGPEWLNTNELDMDRMELIDRIYGSLDA